ncbi:MAG: HEAT repeat domain-containing protein [Saprospiraceae bacterium]|nr:HEAT repeat domain-containing protein [Saprospiraceae bacterium]
MNKDLISDKIIRLIQGDLSLSEQAEMHLMIENDSAVREEYDSFFRISKELQMIKPQATPQREVKRFEAWLQSRIREESGQSEKRVASRLNWWKYAAVASILLVFTLLGTEYFGHVHSAKLELRSQKESLLRLVSADNTTSRIKGINEYYQMKELDTDVRDVLLRVLEYDESTNVRLAALDALGNLIDDQYVKQSLIRILEENSEPVVQMSIISILVKTKEVSLKKTLQDMLDSDQVPDDVKDEAFIGVTRL